MIKSVVRSVSAEKTLKNARGFVLFEGSSRFDGAPIVVIAIVKSSNRKTGNMVQTYILRSDVSPVDCVKQNLDGSICGNCPLRGKHIDGKRKNRVCYVNLGQGPRSVYLAYKNGRYPKISPMHPFWQQLTADRVIRCGTYGDPCALPRAFWSAVLKSCKGWTGYTHAFDQNPDFADILMASADSDEIATRAQDSGWRTFRVHSGKKPLLPTEITCPASEEAGKRTTCEHCQLCQGVTKSAKSIAIIAHGGKATQNAIKSYFAAE